MRRSKPTAALYQHLGKRSISLFLGFSLFASQREITAAEAGTTVAAKSGKLQGIVSLSGRTQAFFEIAGARGLPTSHILAVGEREGDTEVFQIDEEAGTVKIKQAGETIELTFGNEAEPLVTPAPATAIDLQSKPTMRFRLQKATTKQVLYLYQIVAERTLLRPTALRNFELTLRSNGTVQTGDFLAAVEQSLADKDIHFQPDGEKFVIIGREGNLASITPELRDIAEQIGASRQTNLSASHGQTRGTSVASEEEMIPAGFIDFRGVDLSQVLIVFQDLANRTLIREPTLASINLNILTATPLKYSDVIYAFSAMLALNDISIVPVGEKFLMVFSTHSKSRVSSILAKHGPPTKDPRKEPMPPGAIDFRGVDVAQVMLIYKDLCGCNIVLDPSLRAQQLNLRTQTPLTPTEVLQGLDLLLAWDGIEVVRQEDGTSFKFVQSKP